MFLLAPDLSLHIQSLQYLLPYNIGWKHETHLCLPNDMDQNNCQ